MLCTYGDQVIADWASLTGGWAGRRWIDGTWSDAEYHGREAADACLPQGLSRHPELGGIDKWLSAMWMIANDKNGVSSLEMARPISVIQKSAWFMLTRIRSAVQSETFNKISGSAEVGETFIGGNAHFMHKSRRAKAIKGAGGMGKVAVMGHLARHGPDGRSTVRTEVLASQWSEPESAPTGWGRLRGLHRCLEVLR